MPQEQAALPLSFGRFTVSLVPEAPLRLPTYAGGMFRGAFGLALQRVVCVTRTYDCPPCPLKDRCLYPYVFETAPPPDTRIMRKYPTAPRPFVLEPPGPGGTVQPAGAPFGVGLTLFGRALRSLPYCLFAFERMGRVGLGGRRVQCRVSALEAELDGQRWVLYSAEDPLLRASEPFEASVRLALAVPAAGGLPDGRVTLELLTPLRLISAERLADAVPFSLLVRSLLRRLAHLSYFHCGGDPRPVPFREWIGLAGAVRVVEHSLRWQDWARYSSRQQTTMTLGGLLGTITYEGPVGPFLPLLRLGEVTHVGKGTSFGLGRYRIVAAG